MDFRNNNSQHEREGVVGETAGQEAGALWELSELSAQFFCKLQVALKKKKSILLNKKKYPVNLVTWKSLVTRATICPH